MKRWEELDDGRWKLTLSPDDPEDDTPISVYRGTKEKIADSLADSQSSANRRIAELKRSGNGSSPPRTNPEPLSPGERLQTVADLTNPATVDQGIMRVVESKMGSVEEQRARQKAEDDERIDRVGREMATQFAQETPEYYRSQHNADVMFNYFRNTPGMDFTNRAHYNLAFERLTAAKLLQPKPSEDASESESEDEDERERNAPVPVPVPPTPRRVSTGVMGRDISGLPPKPMTRLKYTREQIDDMSAGDYKRLMQADPELGRCVEYYAQQDRQRQRRVG